ncbi:MAG: UDP-N-acetylmuramate dehydrogenase [Thermoguttaceae bacterium]|nr:UDP-N-acetylmuramate dehydrogenase [Thermoguttaceae bacterium]
MKNFARFKQILRTSVPLAMHTWLQLGGQVEYFAEPRNEEELADLLKTANQEGVETRFLGTGTNVLVSDSGVPGMVVRLSAPAFCSINPDAASETISAGTGAKLGRVITSAVYAGLAGLEGLIGIPGTVGGAVRNNISTSDGDIAQWLESVRIVRRDGRAVDLSAADLDFSGGSDPLADGVMTACRFRLQAEEPEELTRRLQKIWILRKKNQPFGYQGAGRLFKDPSGNSASDLIDDAGLKGTRIGGAVICERNSNFVLIEPECSTDDVHRLIRLIQTQVRERSGVDLETDLTLW